MGGGTCSRRRRSVRAPLESPNPASSKAVFASSMIAFLVCPVASSTLNAAHETSETHSEYFMPSLSKKCASPFQILICPPLLVWKATAVLLYHMSWSITYVPSTFIPSSGSASVTVIWRTERSIALGSTGAASSGKVAEAGSVCVMVPEPSFAAINDTVCPSSPFSDVIGDVRKAMAAVEPIMQSRSAPTMAAVPKKSFWKNPLSWWSLAASSTVSISSCEARQTSAVPIQATGKGVRGASVVVTVGAPVW